MLSKELQELYNLVVHALVNDSPYMSGNMQKGIKVVSVGDNEVEIEIEAKFYDIKNWKKTGQVKHTGAQIGGFTDYAYWVNEAGGFFSHNKSEHWVNRSLNSSVGTYANEIGADFRNELEL